MIPVSQLVGLKLVGYRGLKPRNISTWWAVEHPKKTEIGFPITLKPKNVLCALAKNSSCGLRGVRRPTS